VAVTRSQVLAVVRLIEPNVVAAQKLGPDALPHLRKLIRDEDIGLARRAASVATKISDARAVSVVTVATQSPHPEVRLAAAAELWRLAKFDVAKPALRLIADPDPSVRRRTLRSLLTIVQSTALKPAVRRVVEAAATRDAHPANRFLAAAIVRRENGSSPTAEDVRGALAAGVPVRELAPGLGRDALEYLPALVKARDANVAAEAVVLAAALAAKDARPIVEQAASDRRAAVRAAAASVAGRVPRSQALTRMLLDDRDARVRAAALITAGRTKVPGLKKIASNLADNDPDERVRALAAEILRGPTAGR
jgi:HEAT repeat protein